MLLLRVTLLHKLSNGPSLAKAVGQELLDIVPRIRRAGTVDYAVVLLGGIDMELDAARFTIG